MVQHGRVVLLQVAKGPTPSWQHPLLPWHNTVVPNGQTLPQVPQLFGSRVWQVPPQQMGPLKPHEVLSATLTQALPVQV
jgi:hypothetical protein